MSTTGADSGAVLDAVLDLVAVVDARMVVTWVNPAVDTLLRRPASDLLGRSALEAVHEPDRIDAADRLQALFSGSSTVPVSLRLVRGDGSLVWVEVFGGPLGEGPQRQVVLTVRDVGWRRRAELAALRDIGRLDLLVDLARHLLGARPGRVGEIVVSALADLGRTIDADLVTVHEVDPSADQLVARSRWVGPRASHRGGRVATGETVAVGTVPTWVGAVGEGHAPVVLADGHAALEEIGSVEAVVPAVAASVGLRVDDRLVGMLTVAWSTARDVDADLRSWLGRAASVLGVALERDHDRVRLAEREAFFRDLFEDNSAVMYLIDPATLVIEAANAAAAQFYGYPRAELAGMPLHALTTLDADALRRRVDAIRETGQVIIDERQRLASGELRDVEIRSTRVRVANRALDLAIVTDVTERLRAEAELHRLADTDDLTGALSRRRFLALASEEIVRSARHRRDLSLLMLDLDHFKRVNDTHGHATGDRVLRAFAVACGEVLRTTDRFARLGGEEFAVLLPETDAEGAVQLAERLRGATAELRVETAGPPVQLTVSVGVACWKPDDTLDGLLRRADQRLYRAKAAGRDRVVAD
ncbi:MAG TPA: diguanylate cyclase [Acidimicrobiales bacterium]|nr:diguanylate cyclase [Acidimicrobiales bacterium]